MAELRFGLIGLGVHGDRYAAHLQKDVPGARLVAVCRRRRAEGEAWAAAHAVRYHARWQDLVADPQVDAVAVVATPDVNLEVTREAVRRKKHLVIEKPLAVNRETATRLVAAVSGAPIAVMVAQTLRWNSVVRTIKAHVAEIAPLHLVTLSQRMEPLHHAWQADREVAGGGNVLHTGVHLFDLLRFLTGDEVEHVSCEMRRLANPHLEDVFAAVMTLAGSGVRALVDSAKTTRSRSGRIEVVGEGGQLVGDHVHGFAKKIVGYDSIDLTIPPPVFTVRESLADFVRAVAHGTQIPVSLVEGLRAVEIAEACYHSAAEGRAVPVQRAFA
jgi:predicted dehydrogenase